MTDQHPDLRSDQRARPVALITGATRGLGLAVAQALAPTHHLIIGGRSAAAVSALVAALPSASPFVADLTDSAAVSDAASSIVRLDVLVNNAGIVPPEGTSLSDSWRAVLEVNVTAVVALTEALMPALRSASGLVVFINSGAGLNPWGTDGYSASKYALTSYADALRVRERGSVRVSSVHPGRVDTDMQRELQGRSGRAYHPGDHLSAQSVGALVRFIVDCPADAVVESVSIRPALDRLA